MVERKELKLAYRFIPCPVYDVSRMEYWLSEMAEQGLLLQEDGFFCGIATFEKTIPQKVTYRLQPASKSTSMWASNNGDPEDEEVELSREFGWEYVAKRGEFYIYRTSKIDARELHTDRKVQALAMNAMKKRQWDNIISMLFFAIVYPYLVMNGKIIVSMVHVGTIPMGLVLVAIIWMTINSIVRAVRLLKLRRKVLQGESIGSGNEWRKGVWLYHINNILRKCIYVVALILLLKTWGNLMIYENYIPLTEYTGDVPFKTMAEFVPNGQMELMNMKVGNMNTVREWSDFLSPVNYEWDEYGTVICSDGKRYSGGLEVIYHETKADWIADRMVVEYFRKGKQEKEYQPLELIIEGLDDVVAFDTKVRFPSVILRKGNKILFARFYTNGGEDISFELVEWAGFLAESLLEGDYNEQYIY